MKTLSTREALKQVLDTLDGITAAHCAVCVPPAELTGECKKHDRRWQKALREARAALTASLN